ncbi:hypothetical protein A8M32_26360 [Sinorhizobium alkalisoli]|uniref:Uncharacterized protein n=1 Tax=Sinorhizobium alkalisoli TaxID=1752398 RepID=A0A1E3V4H2_9HYPH|nr:hypothetical protein A8M32_26360 [Sinorhizobium alkalisoli]
MDLYYIKSALEDEDWETAYEESQKLSDEDLKRTPALLSVRADATLMLAVPEELRLFLLQFMPFNLSTYPLRSDPASFDLRRRAVQYYEQLRDAMRELGLSAVAANADDKALWLRLMDPETRNGARDELRKSIQEPLVLFRRLNFALHFGIAVDLEQVEQEVDRQTALSGGSSAEAAFARYVLAHTKPTAAEAAAYLDRHRSQLLRHLQWKAVYFFEIEALARAGERATAEERFPEHTISGMNDPDGTAPCCMDEEEAGGSSWIPLAQVLMQLPKNLHHHIVGDHLAGIDKPVHQHLRDRPGILTIGYTICGPVHHDAQELTLAYTDPGMIAIVGGPGALLA